MRPTEDALLDLVDRIYDLPLQPENWGEISSALEQITRGRVAILTKSERSVGFMQPCSAGGKADVDEYLDRYWTTDRAMCRLRDAPAGAVAVDSRLVTEDERERVAFYREYLRPRDLHRGCYTVLSRQSGQALILGVHRPNPRDDFEDECLQVLARIRPHLARGLAIARRFAETSAVRDAASTALGQTGWGMILTTADGTVRFANANGEARLNGSLTVRNGRLEACHARPFSDLKAAIARAARRSGGQATQLALAVTEDEVLRLSVSPARAEAQNLAGEPLALILIADADTAPDAGRLSQEYGLTPSEISLFHALVEGERLADYAERMGVKLTTAKTHLGSIFAKTGVRRQAELVRRALTDPALRLPMKRLPPEPDWGGARRSIEAA
ncbi:hypothetical protein D3C85_486690 [compost metagenome]